ncbi:pyruvate synthase subunit PorB [Archaeoglobus veneficus]|uniref:Pyruvate synthase n=1 Tax=Archaeoglobus veneficus (strain DSM 11195 / SNP6) TaxID=693661 RepID=F2KRX1_ARCVS|nr:pyruvate synthase subunit PorB [Archaeoglobus veneficus]AEA46812.1 Pyruvate synthase [Archaeoglobus veneficus SNP6]
MVQVKGLTNSVAGMPAEELLAPGHTACPGCGQTLAVRIALKAIGRNAIACMATGCLEVSTGLYNRSAWRIPCIHMLFENAAAVASGIERAVKRMGKDTKVVVFAGDGGTIDIGFGALSGMLERGHNVIYICLDNEAYMNTGVQRSGATPYAAHTTTSPSGEVSIGNPRPKKDAPWIVAAHHIPYVATASSSYPKDLFRKVKRACEVDGPAYIQVHVPCPTGWGYDTSKTVEVGRLAVETALWVNYEVVDDEVTNVMKIGKRKPVEEYLKMQKRFRHLFASEEGRKEIERIQAIADYNARKFGLDEML